MRLIHHKFNINKYPGTVWFFLDIYFAINPIYNTALRIMPFHALFHFHFVSVKKYKSIVNALNPILLKVSFWFSLFLLSNMSSAFYILFHFHSVSDNNTNWKLKHYFLSCLRICFDSIHLLWNSVFLIFLLCISLN